MYKTICRLLLINFLGSDYPTLVFLSCPNFLRSLELWSYISDFSLFIITFQRRHFPLIYHCSLWVWFVFWDQMGDRTQSQYVKLKKDQVPLEDITPGELNQPIEVPQVWIHTRLFFSNSLRSFSVFLLFWILGCCLIVELAIAWS